MCMIFWYYFVCTVKLRKCENDESVGHLFEACGEYSDILYETGF